MAQATNTTEGQIVLSGDLYGDDATFPTLVPSGVTEGTYTGFKNTGTAIPSAPFYSYVLHVDAKGRITYAKEYGVSVAVNDATAISKGIARIGTGINGSSGTWSIPDGTTSTRGKLRAGSGLGATNGTMYCTYSNAPLASASVFGAAQPGSYMNMTNGALTVDFSNLIASDSVTGTVKVGSNLTVTGDGTLSHASWADGTTSSKGFLQVGSTLSVSSGVVSIPDGSAVAKGKLQVGDGLNVSAGVVSLNRTSYATDTVAGVVKSGWSTGVSGSGVMTLSPGWAAVGYKGIVSVGAGLSVTGGAISLSEPTRKAATASQAGLVKVPTANGLSVAGDGTVNYDYTQNAAVADATNVVKGKIQPGVGFTVTDGQLSLNKADGSNFGSVAIVSSSNCIYEYSGVLDVYPAHTFSGPGLVKLGGSNLSLNGSNQLTASFPAIQDAATNAKGILQVTEGNGLSISGGVLSFNRNLPTATTNTLGIARPDNSSMTISGGVLSFSAPSNFQKADTFTQRTKNYAVTPHNKTDATNITLQEDVTITNVYLDAGNSNTRVLPTGTLTTNIPVGTELFLILQQDSSGGVNFSPATVAGTTLSTAPNTETVIKYVVINTNKAVPVYAETGL